MHPEVRQDGPGDCPICGMALEPIADTSGGDEEDGELRWMTRRLIVSAILTLPVFVLAMGPMVGVDVHRWMSASADPRRARTPPYPTTSSLSPADSASTR